MCSEEFIIGRVIKAMNCNWHPDCFSCQLCNAPLADAGFIKNAGRYVFLNHLFSPYKKEDEEEKALLVRRIMRRKTRILERRGVGKRTREEQKYLSGGGLGGKECEDE